MTTPNDYYVHTEHYTSWHLTTDLTGMAPVYDNIDLRHRAYNPLLPDEFWIMSCNTASECYSVGSEDEDRIPKEVNGIPVYPMFRGGKTTYHGPGQMTVLMILDGKRLLSQRDPGIQVAEFINVSIFEAIKEYALERFNIELHYRNDDPGLYTNAGAKISSTGFDVRGHHYFYSYNINLSTDLSKYEDIAVCGVRGRVMGNLITDRKVDDAETFAESEILLPKIWRRLYHRADRILRWPDTALEGTPVQI